MQEEQKRIKTVLNMSVQYYILQCLRDPKQSDRQILWSNPMY